MNKPLIVIGAGGHAKVLMHILLLQKSVILGLADADANRLGQEILGVKINGNDDWVFGHDPKTVELVNGVGSIDQPRVRQSIFEKFKSKGYNFAQVIHPSVIQAAEIDLGEGVQIMAGAILQPSVRIGLNTLVNTGAIVDHDCQIGNHCHLAPGVTLSGSISVGFGTHIGTGASIIQGVRIGQNCVIGAGALVRKNVADHSVAVGVPAKVRT